jgi:aminoglycoside 3-N-acetyltransferase
MADAAMSEDRSNFPRRLKERARPFYLRGRQWLARALFAYGVDDLKAAVGTLGIGAGDSLLLHSGFRRDSGFKGEPGDVIDGLLDVLGPEGHLLMMSMAYRGSSEGYCAGDPLFDITRTPSALGLLSEVFRRRQGVLRSLNPLHPVLAHGPLAGWLVADHDKCAHSCGRGSPFERFLKLDGKFLFLDAPYSALTFMHYVEDCFRGRLPVELYAPEPAIVRVRDARGREIRLRQYCFSAAARARRNFAPIEQKLRAEGRMRGLRVGNSRLLAVRARDVLDCAAALLEQGAGFYR